MEVINCIYRFFRSDWWLRKIRNKYKSENILRRFSKVVNVTRNFIFIFIFSLSPYVCLSFSVFEEFFRESSLRPNSKIFQAYRCIVTEKFPFDTLRLDLAFRSRRIISDRCPRFDDDDQPEFSGIIRGSWEFSAPRRCIAYTYTSKIPETIRRNILWTLLNEEMTDMYYTNLHMLTRFVISCFTINQIYRY